MSDDKNYLKVLESIVRKDPRYPIEALVFVQNAVSYTVDKLYRSKNRKIKHISGPQLLDGIKDFALQQFGPMAVDIFEYWGITNTEDFGKIVFKLVDHNLLSARKEDKLEDFKNGYDFDEVFNKKFQPTGKKIKVPVIA